MRKLLTILLLLLAVVAQGQMIIRANPFARAQVSSEIVIPDSVENGYYTRGWYEVGDGSSTYMTLDGSVLTAWKDLSGNSNDLVNAAGTDRPTWDSDNLEIDFDGADDYLSDGSFVYAQPITVYAVINIVAATTSEDIFRINTGTNGKLTIQNAASTVLIAYGGGSSFSTAVGAYSEGTYYIFRVVFNNDVANGSKIQINSGAATAGTLANASATVFQLPTESGACPQMSVKAVIIRTMLDDATTQTAIVNYLNAKYSVY
jgi:hypothetical protein